MNALDDLMAREWILPNGRGGFAYGTASGIRTRKYHGWLVDGFGVDGTRQMWVADLEETLEIDGQDFAFSSHRYTADAIYPEGFKFLEDYQINPDSVTWQFGSFAEHDIGVRRRVAVAQGLPMTAVEYHLFGRKRKARLAISPLITHRDVHQVKTEAPYHSERGDEWNGERKFWFNPCLWTVGSEKFGVIEVVFKDAKQKLYLVADDGNYARRDVWYHDFQYEKELLRGYPSIEDLYAPGTFWSDENQRRLRLFFLVADDDQDAQAKFQQGLNALSALHAKPPSAPQSQTSTPILQKWQDRLRAQTGDFTVRTADDKPHLIAGYPWFGLWSRDEMTSLEGLLLKQGDQATASQILLASAEQMVEGRLPNLFEETHKRYQFLADVPLWWTYAVHKYWQASGDRSLVKSIWPQWEAMIVALLRSEYTEGQTLTEQGYLSFVGDGSRAATWMDAIVQGQAVTPRYGCPVEVQALWYNALMATVELGQQAGVSLASIEQALSAHGHDQIVGFCEHLQRHFSQDFWLEGQGYLADVWREGEQDATLRPNQLLTAALSFPLISPEQAQKLLRHVDMQLLTPVGLRTLSPDHPRYMGEYQGDQAQRDQAYHQGAIWPWLWGPYARAGVHAEGAEATAKKLKSSLRQMFATLDEMGRVYVPELFSGSSFHPHGSVHQAWNVAMLLMVFDELDLT